MPVEELGEHDQLGAALARRAGHGEGLLDIGFAVLAHRHLDESDRHCLVHCQAPSPSRWAGARLLLGDAVHVAAESTISRPGTVTTSRLGKRLCKAVARRSSFGVVEDGHHDPAVTDVEVEVGGGHASPARRGIEPSTESKPQASSSVNVTSAGTGTLTTSNVRPRGVGGALQALQVVLHDLAAPVGGVVGQAIGEDLAGRDEAGDVVDVSGGLVGVEAAAEPDDGLDVQVVAQAVSISALLMPGCGPARAGTPRW